MTTMLSIVGFALLFALYGVLRTGGRCTENCGACTNACGTAHGQDES
jgi:hypothetical protein